MSTQEDLLRSLIADVGILRAALIAVLEKSTPEVRQAFARAITLRWTSRSRIRAILVQNFSCSERPSCYIA